MDLDSYLFHYMHYSWHSIYREFCLCSYHISCKSIIYHRVVLPCSTLLSATNCSCNSKWFPSIFLVTLQISLVWII